MAVAAGHRPGFLAFVGDLLVTADAALVIEVHLLVFTGSFQGFVDGRQIAIVANGVTAGAILVALRNCIRV